MPEPRDRSYCGTLRLEVDATDVDVRLHVFADQPHLLAAQRDAVAAYRAVVEQADRLFRGRGGYRLAFRGRDSGIAIVEATGGQPIVLMLGKGEVVRSASIDYTEGLRFPDLERIEGVPPRLDDILRPL